MQFCALVLGAGLPAGARRAARGLFAGVTVAVLVPVAFLADPPVENDRLVFYELVFAVAAVTGAIFTGRIAASESLAGAAPAS